MKAKHTNHMTATEMRELAVEIAGLALLAAAALAVYILGAALF